MDISINTAFGKAIGDQVRRGNKWWDEQTNLIKTSGVALILLLGLIFLPKAVLFILIVAMFGQRVIYHADTKQGENSDAGFGV